MATRYAHTTCGIRILLKYKVFTLFMMILVSHFSIAEEDPYLSAISSEAEKVESAATPPSSETVEAGEMDGPSLQAFEEDLKTRYMGSFTFYKKLPRRSREEVFEEYRGGASIDEIRKKIMDRFLNQ
ncbi:MAG: hypothetical protein ABW098_01400 [Candidatus Thiodiazotropha sp.]